MNQDSMVEKKLLTPRNTTSTMYTSSTATVEWHYKGESK
jgi:hypothetical protein